MGMNCFSVNLNACINDQEVTIGCFSCNNYSEMIKFLRTCEELEIPIILRKDAESFNSSVINDIGGMAFIDDISVRFGDDTCIQCIDVMLK